MNRFRPYGIIALLSLCCLFGCDKDKGESSEQAKTPRIKKKSRLLTPKSNTKFVLGESISFELKSDLTIDSVLLDDGVKTTRYDELAFEWLSKDMGTGKQRLRLDVYGEGQKETHYARLTFLSDVAPIKYTYEIVKELNHDPTAYTQGLFFSGDTLFESTGREGQSRLIKKRLDGKEYKSVNLPSEYFGEGSTEWEDKIIMLTWTGNTGFVFDRSLKQTGTFHYSHEGWGITTYGDTLIVSDGSEVLHLLDPRDFSEIGKLEVYDHKRKVNRLNELEMINGLLYANIYLEEEIVAIDPATGKVVQRIDMSGISSKLNTRDVDVLNGIAYKANSDQLFVTGKLWPKLFEVKFIPTN
ncbi:glutaminyl-peptide cyclotransferase [Marinoscillum furvescens]|uniref:Glutamine cyclotransferase n=1 Tax=Marinoscillum furvescens DSM 4134 TaxID=1122208 RepID=A0A3D9L446_MARFU|nr:glutaminyl-peptide cyclotransferase [Marinoscillum furvescens]RED99438.1 glutamine cyclotransferase [Marinoscillum furvescens DSM 4134]